MHPENLVSPLPDCPYILKVEPLSCGETALNQHPHNVDYFSFIHQAYLLGKLIRVYPEKTFRRVWKKIASGFDSDTEEVLQRILIGDTSRNPHLFRLILTTYHEPLEAWEFRFLHLWNINSEKSHEDLRHLHGKDLHYVRACGKHYYQHLLLQHNLLKRFFNKLSWDCFVNFRVDLQKFVYRRKGSVKDLRATHITEDDKGNLTIDNWPFEPIIHSSSTSCIKGDPERQSTIADQELVECYHIWKNFPEERDEILGRKEKGRHQIRVETEGEDKSFPFSIFKKYDGLVQSSVANARKKDLARPIQKRDRKGSKPPFAAQLREEGIIPGIESYDPAKGAVASWLKVHARGYVTKRFRSKNHTTTAWEKPCTEDMVEVWSNCRYKRPEEKDDPLCQRRRKGLCTHPEAKRVLLRELLDPGPCYMGVDQGKDLHVVISRKLYGTAQIIHIGVYRDWDELDRLIKAFHVALAVVDALPETRNARALAERHRRKVYLNYYSIHQKGSYLWNEKQLIVTSNRTESLDTSHNQILGAKVILPRECEIVREFAKHLCGVAKKLEEDEETGSKRYVYVKLGADHFRHAFNYDAIARQHAGGSFFAGCDFS